MKAKRHSITAIIHKAIRLSTFCYHNGLGSKRLLSIEKAAVNEIIRLQAKEEYADQVERLQQRLGEIDMMEEICGEVKP